MIVSGKSGESGSTHYASMFGISNIELFPRPPSACSIPDLPQPRSGHSLSLLSEKLLVACGAYDCISWVAGNQSWTHLYTMRCNLIWHILSDNAFYKHNHSVARSYHTAWTPPSRPNSIVLLGGKGSGERLAEILPGVKTKASINHFARWRNICFEEQRVWRVWNPGWGNTRLDRRRWAQKCHTVEE